MKREFLRILHITEHFYPQLGYQDSYLPKVETEAGYDVYVLSGNLLDKTIYKANKEILRTRKTRTGLYTADGIRTIRLPAFHLPIVNSLYLVGMEEVIAKLRPDVIVCHGIVFLTAIRVARLRKRLPSVKIIYDDHMTYNASRGGVFHYVYSLFKILFTPMIVRSADLIVAVTHETKRFMEEIYGIPSQKITIVPLGVDTKIFRRDPTTRKELRAKYAIGDNDVVFIYAGKITPEKGIHLLVDAGLKIVRKQDNVKIMFVGGGSDKYRSELSRKTEASGFEARFIFISAVSNDVLYKYYSAADVGVWPLQCSLTMLEAMSCYLPVILSDNSGALERISRENGLAYHEGDTNDLVKKMEMLLNPERRKTMGLNARKFAEQNDWKVISNRFLEFAGGIPEKSLDTQR